MHSGKSSQRAAARRLCAGRGRLCHRSFSGRELYLITTHHCALLLNKDTFDNGYTCTSIQVPCSHKYSSWALEGMGVTSKFRRTPNPSCSYFTVANVHINNECAKRRSVCIALLLLVRNLCLQLGGSCPYRVHTEYTSWSVHNTLFLVSTHCALRGSR